jgi:predicted MFS family arabinose efflux permease
LFYGWHMVGACIVFQAFAVGLTSYIFGLFQKPIAAEFGASFRQVGLGMTLMVMAGSVVGPILGVALDRYSIRAIMMAGGVLMAAGFGLMSVAPALWMLGVLFGGVVGVGVLALGIQSCPKLVANWFMKYRGRALGISAVGTSVGGLLAPPLMAMAIARYGWRGALGGAAVVVALVAVPLVWFVVVNRPEDLGLVRDGVDGTPATATLPPVGAMPMSDWTFGALLQDLNFWVITISMGVCFASVTSVIANLHPYATDLGIGSGPAALLLSCISISGIGGKLLFGAAADHFQARHALWLAMAGLALFLGVLLSHPSYGVLVAGSMVGGLALGGVSPVWGALIGRCYGRQTFGRVMGLMAPAMGPLMWTVFPFTGWVRDRTGSYDAAFVVFLAALLLGAGLLTMLRLPQREPGT